MYPGLWTTSVGKFYMSMESVKRVAMMTTYHIYCGAVPCLEFQRSQVQIPGGGIFFSFFPH